MTLGGGASLALSLACAPTQPAIDTRADDLEQLGANKGPSPSTQEPRVGKRGAPVDIAGTAGRDAADVTVTFDAPADEVDIEVRGIDGLKLESADPIVTGASVGTGESRALRVTYEAPDNESNLVITVSGRFGGLRLIRVGSLTVAPRGGADGADGIDGIDGADGIVRKRLLGSDADITVIDGQRVRLLPAQTSPNP